MKREKAGRIQNGNGREEWKPAQHTKPEEHGKEEENWRKTMRYKETKTCSHLLRINREKQHSSTLPKGRSCRKELQADNVVKEETEQIRMVLYLCFMIYQNLKDMVLTDVKTCPLLKFQICVTYSSHQSLSSFYPLQSHVVVVKKWYFCNRLRFFLSYLVCIYSVLLVLSYSNKVYTIPLYHILILLPDTPELLLVWEAG